MSTGSITAGILRPILLPPEGGETGFVDQIAAYERLPVELKARIEGLEVAYRWSMDFTEQRFGATPGVKILRMDPRAAKQMARPGGHPLVVHPMVFTQPETGRKVLNVSPWFALGIEGMENAEGDALLSDVVAHATDPTGAYYHRWQAKRHGVVRHWRMMHCALGVPPGLQRHMQRTTIAGDYGFGRLRDRNEKIDDAIRVNV